MSRQSLHPTRRWQHPDVTGLTTCLTSNACLVLSSIIERFSRCCKHCLMSDGLFNFLLTLQLFWSTWVSKRRICVFMHCKNKLVVLITEWLPWLLTNLRQRSLLWYGRLIRQEAAAHLWPQYTDNPQNTCEGVTTNALQSCSKGVSCKHAGDSQMFWGFLV